MTTFAGLADIASARIRDPNHEVVTCTTWYTYLNLAWKQVQQASDQWPWNQDYDEIEVTVAANARQGCLDATGEVLSVRYVYDSTNSAPLVQITDSGARSRYHLGNPAASVAPGAPMEYRIKGNEIEVFPLPATAVCLQIGVNKWSGTDLVYSESPPIPAAFHTILVDGALALFHADDGNDQGAARATEAFQVSIANLKGAFLDGQTEKYPLLADTF